MNKRIKRRKRGVKIVPASDASAPGAGAPVATATSITPAPSSVRVTFVSLGLRPMTDAGNAEFIASIYGDALRYDHKRGRWLLWDKQRHQWSEDGSHSIYVLAIHAARHRRQLGAKITEAKDGTAQIKWAYQSEDRHRLDSALGIAKSLPPVSDTGNGWDANPYLFGVANGVIDLRTGTLQEEKQEDRITNHSPIRYDSDAECPRFEEFLAEICDGDGDLFWYLWKAIGYCLTGVIQEQCIFCCYGLGANGKSTLFFILYYILGDYAQNLPFSALELKNRNNNDLVKLADCRFATASETNEGVRLNEARIKALTGGDPITARQLYHESFTFLPTHKLWLAFNHKPIIADDSEGIWRRVHLIPFRVQFTGENEDKHLDEKLLAEANGILTWAVKGCLLWQKEGLGMPPTVAQATAAYREESDNLGQFIDDCCSVGPDVESLSSVLWQRYQGWAKENEEVPLNRQIFSDRLKRRGFKADRGRHGGQRLWVGIKPNGDAVTRGDAVSDFSPTREIVYRENTKTVSPGVTASPSSQKFAPNGASSSAEPQAEESGDVEKRVLEVEI